MRLVDDGNVHQVLRLTVEHWGTKPKRPLHAIPDAPAAAECPPMPGAAIWVCIASDLDEAAFAGWRGKLPRLAAEVDAESLRLSAVGGKVPVRLTVTDPWRATRKVRVAPAPPDGVLSLNGTELGRPIFESLEPIREAREKK